jgi:cobyrinic acid a,c-diamide synthase
MDRLLVSAPHKSAGKTTVSLGLCAALAAQGTRVQPFKKGPDYIDPTWLARAAGRPCFNLDPYLMDDAALVRCFRQGLHGAELALVEGNHGLHDGMALDGSNSNAALAKRLGLPVVLVVDARGMARGVAPLVLGFQAFDRDVRIAGVILNRVRGERHEGKLRAALEHYTDIPVLGAIGEDERLALHERHLGLVASGELDDAAARVQRIGRIVGAQVDLDTVRAVAASAAPGFEPMFAAPRATPDLRIAIARDRAFSFYYPDDLAALEAAGAELVFFDTLRDTHLPAVDALFIGGGFPETCMAELEANLAMRTAVRGAIEDGLPTYAECGGLMYLARGIEWHGRRARMAGVIPGDAVMQDRPVGRGYVQLRETASMPWPGGAPRSAVAAHEFHHSRIENLPEGLNFAWRVIRGQGIARGHDGLRLHNLLASYAHLRSAAGSDWAARFVAFARERRAEAARADPLAVAA